MPPLLTSVKGGYTLLHPVRQTPIPNSVSEFQTPYIRLSHITPYFVITRLDN